MQARPFYRTFFFIWCLCWWVAIWCCLCYFSAAVLFRMCLILFNLSQSSKQSHSLKFKQNKCCRMILHKGWWEKWCRASSSQRLKTQQASRVARRQNKPKCGCKSASCNVKFDEFSLLAFRLPVHLAKPLLPYSALFTVSFCLQQLMPDEGWCFCLSSKIY